MNKSGPSHYFHLHARAPPTEVPGCEDERMLACQSVNRPKHVVRWYEEFHWLRNHFPHMQAHGRQSKRQNIIPRTHTWQQCLVSTSEAILTTKYGFNFRQNSPLNIENNTGYSGWIQVSVAHALIGPQSLKLAHFEATYAGSLPYNRILYTPVGAAIEWAIVWRFSDRLASRKWLIESESSSKQINSNFK